jgi:FkbM family methyltransferase
MRVFLDIGAHTGETLHEVQKPVYGFDRIFTFEPSKQCLPVLNAIAARDGRVQVCPFGLSNRDDVVSLYDPGTLAGSVFTNEDAPASAEEIRLVKASRWFDENLSKLDFIVVKTNCEGSEVDILDDLLRSGWMSSVYTFLVTFDIRAYPKLRHKEVEIRRRLKQAATENYCFSDDVMIGTTHDKRIAHWLHLFGVDQAGEDVGELRRSLRPNFSTYASKSGLRPRLESRLKQQFRYEAFPAPLKSALQFAKRSVGLHRERDMR